MQLRNYERCMVCREKFGEGDYDYHVDGRVLCPDCAEVYKNSHYPWLREEEFRKRYGNFVRIEGGLYPAVGIHAGSGV